MEQTSTHTRKLINGSSIDLGVCYYPEHWDKSLWAELLRGEFTYDFFDGFLELAGEKGMQVIFCTPTATPPAWLTEKYPEVLNADMDGHLYRHGSRRHYNYNSPVYGESLAPITAGIPPSSDGSWTTNSTVRMTCFIPKVIRRPSAVFCRKNTERWRC